ncbi:MAG: AmmeMemoRadiSam system radical SAM enzyme [Desulfobacterales bacterium]|nr:MAG: AmmeMemoRadiSam system radical SAM enzyme [Desulfobacterales bacterium]
MERIKEAYLYNRLTDDRVRCQACHHYCEIQPGRQGLCRVRENRSGTLVSLVYDKVVAASVDPIEKKPIFHLKPGSTSFSIATMGCNLKCRFCQNADIAHPKTLGVERRAPYLAGRPFSPEDIVDQAQAHGCDSIAYTYTEPSVFFELALDTARLARSRGLYNIFVTNGFMSPALIEMVAPVLDAANVDLKAFTDSFYKTYCSARIEPVKDTLRLMKANGIMVEVTTLVIPGLNDDASELAQAAEFIANDLGPETPWHLSRFHPAYKLQDLGLTPESTLQMACEVGENAGLQYVYTGNVRGARENTYCPCCRAVVVQRHGYHVSNRLTPNGGCPECGTRLYGIYESL